MPHEEAPTILEEEPDDTRRAAIASVLEEIQANSVAHSRELTWQEREARAHAFYDQAVERENRHGLDEETQALYEQVSDDLLYLTWRGSKDRAKDPLNLMELGGSLARQAQATKPGVFYEDIGGRHIDKKSNLQDIAAKTLHQAFELMVGKPSEQADRLSEEMTAINPVEVLAEAAVEAAVEIGTEEHVLVNGIGKVDENTPEVLESEGRDAVVRFIDEHGAEPLHGAEFLAITTEHAIEEIKATTAVHELPDMPAEKIAA